MIRKDFSLLSISIKATKKPLSFFSKYCRIKISPRKAYLYLPFGENQRDFQSRRMPKRCEYGGTVWVILFFRTEFYADVRSALPRRTIASSVRKNSITHTVHPYSHRLGILRDWK